MSRPSLPRLCWNRARGFPLRLALHKLVTRFQPRNPIPRAWRSPVEGPAVVGPTAWMAASHQQRGAALIVALILLLILSILGITSMRTTTMEEKMAAASHDRAIAFQAAEAALREGEAVALAQSTTSPKNAAFPNGGLYNNDNSNCNTSPCNAQGLCAQPDPDCPARWLDPNFNSWTNASKVNDIAGTPQYFVEYLGSNFPCDPANPNSPTTCSNYRITARSHPGTGRASVMLQSVFLTN